MLAVLVAVFLAFSTPALAQTCVAPPPGIIAWWPFDETNGTIAADIVGTEPAAYFGSPTPSAGKVGGALFLHGSTGTFNGDFLAAPANSQWDFGPRDFTIELWANFSVAPGGSVGHPGAIFIGDDEGPGNQNKWFFALGGGYLNFHINGPALGPQFFPLVPFSPAVGVWYHLAVVRRGSTYTIFINGTPAGSATNANAIPSPNAPLTIGQAESLGFMNGLLDEMTVYSRALTQTELQSIFNAGMAGKCKPSTASSPALAPTFGGNQGQATLTITGVDFTPATGALLVMGEQRITASSVSASADGKTLLATFDLTGQPVGVWDLDLTTPGQPASVLAGAFTIQQAQPLQLWSDVVGRGAVRLGFADQVQVTFGNRSNVDAHNVVIWLATPSSIAASPILPYVDATDVPLNDPPLSTNGLTYYWFFTDQLSAGETRTVPVGLIASTTGQFALQTGIFDGTSVLRSLSVSPAIAALRVASSVITEPDRRARQIRDRGERINVASLSTASGPRTGDIVFKASDPLTPSGFPELPTGHVGIFVDSTPGSSSACQPQCVIDFVTRGGIGPDQGYYRELPLSVWAPDNTYLGSGRPNDMTDAQAAAAASAAMQAYQDWLASGRPYLPYSIPAGVGSGNDCVSVVDNFYRKAGYVPLWDDWSSPGALYELITSSIWPGLTWQLAQAAVHDFLPETLIYKSLQNILYRVVASLDPNEKAGSPGIGPQQYISGQEPLRYTIFFENSASASASAQQVTVTDQLETANLDLNTLSLGTVSFGSRQVPITPGLSNYLTDIDLRPATPLIVRIQGSLNKSTGVLSWQFTSLDPSTGQLTTDPLAGFLPPNVVPPQGDASVSFTVMPRSGISTGTQIQNGALIIFDQNAPISTPMWFNTIDSSPPKSSVQGLSATQSCPNFRVSWSGSDMGSGLRGFTIYVSDTGAPYTAWLSNTTAVSAPYLGAAGHSYSFYSIATDLTGNMEGAKTSPDTFTSVTGSGSCGAPSVSGLVSNVSQSGTTVTLNLQLTNTGFTAAQAVNINQITFRTLSGSGTVTLASPVLPASEGPLGIGASITVPLTLIVPTTVTRFSMTEGGNLKDGAGNTYNYSMAQTVIP
jgi:hypothetical protein